MRLRSLLLVFLLGLALGAAPTGSAALRLGVADDTGKYAEDGGSWFFSELGGIGLTDNRISIAWDPARPTTIGDKAFLDRSLPVAALHRIRVIASVYPARPTSITDSADGPAQFAAFLQLVARTYPQITDFVIGNEPNQPRFWRPQFNADGSPAAGAAYEDTLARAYDALKAVNPNITVIGFAVSSRGNDDADAPSNISTSPVRFIQGAGAAYRASGRTAPIMDELGFHPYPRSSTDSVDAGFQWPNAGVANLDRIKQAVWDAFDGTGQPTFERGLGLAIDEVGWQVGVVPSAQGAYTGTESVQTADEASQAEIYSKLIDRVACDPSVTALYLFGLIDESDLGGFQAGLIRADGTRRPSFDSVEHTIADGVRCDRTPVSWRHVTSVVGAGADFGDAVTRPAAASSWTFTATALEDSSFTAGLFRVPGPRGLSERTADQLGAVLAGTARKPRAEVAASGAVPAYRQPPVRFAPRRVRPGFYVFAIRLTADTNPSRATVLVGRPFRVGALPKS
jgi:hypothetical protein